MSNIDSIKEDYNIGDPIRIVCSLGVKEGFIESISENRIKIRPFEKGRKPISISEENIKDFEEAIVPNEIESHDIPSPSTQSVPKDSEENVASDDSVEIISHEEQKDQNGNDIDSAEDDLSQPTNLEDSDVVEEAENVDTKDSTIIEEDIQDTDIKKPTAPEKPSFVKGYVNLALIDSTGGVRPTVHKGNLSKLLLEEQPVPEELVDSRSYKSQDENKSCLYSTGFITDDNEEYGWIWDQNLKKKVFFSISDICDDQLYNLENIIGVSVSYIKIAGNKGPKAVGVCLPRPIYQALSMIDSKMDDKSTKQEALDLLETLLSQYPDNEDAKYKLREFGSDITSKKVKRRCIQSKTDKLNTNSSIQNSSNKGKLANPAPSMKNSSEYQIAKSLVNERKPEEALPHLLAALKESPKSANIIKDILTLYCSLCSKKYLQENPDKQNLADYYREEGRKFIKNNVHLLPEEQTTYNVLENDYYALQDYESYLGVVDKVISIKVPSQRVIFLTKKAYALLNLKRIEDARATIKLALNIDSENVTAKKMLSQIESDGVVDSIDDEFFAVSDNPISSLLHDRINNYTEYYGVFNYVKGDETRLFTEENYQYILNKLKGKEIQKDSLTRSQLLLTKMKLYKEIYKTDSVDKHDLALYCNDMARVTILKYPNNIPWDVVRFYFLESFSLAASWRAVKRQFGQYLDTFIPSRRNDIFGILPESEIESRIENNILQIVNGEQDKNDLDWMEVLLHPSIYNEIICAKVINILYSNDTLRQITSNRLVVARKLSNSEDSLAAFGNAWRDLCDNRYSQMNNLYISFESRRYENLARLNGSLQSLSQETRFATWMFSRDRNRLNSLFNQLIPKIQSFITASGFESKEDNYGDAIRLLEKSINSINDRPTKFTYESLLPLLNHYKSLLEKEWQSIVESSVPKVIINLLGTSFLRDANNHVSLQVGISTHKESSPISKIMVSIEDSDTITYLKGEETVHTDMIRGGEAQIIFHMKVHVSDKAVQEKVTTIVISCTYEKSNGEQDRCRSEFPLRLYAENEFESFKNPFYAGKTVQREDMFYGRGEFIDLLVNSLHTSDNQQLLFYGQKRSGKSSVLYWLKKRLEKEDAFCVSFSLSTIVGDPRGAIAFFYQILYEIYDALKSYDGEKPEFNLPPLGEYEKINPSNPVFAFRIYMSEFKRACRAIPSWKDKMIVIMIDEFTYLYSLIKENKLDNSIFKQWKGIIENEDTSFMAVLVGQDAVPYLAKEEYAKNVIEMMDLYRMSYLDEKDARDLIDEPIFDKKNGNSRYATGAIESIIEYSACNPYYIQMICHELVKQMLSKKAIIATTADVNEAVDKLISDISTRQSNGKDDSFDNLKSSADSIHLEGISDNMIMEILIRIALLTENVSFCTDDDIFNYANSDSLVTDTDTANRILEDLCLREVLEMKKNGVLNLYKIKVGLFKKYLISTYKPTNKLT